MTTIKNYFTPPKRHFNLQNGSFVMVGLGKGGTWFIFVGVL